MIGRLHGMIADKTPPQVLVDCHGVGYEVDVPMSTFYQLPAVGEPVTLLTHLVVREDAHLLFGFASAAERAAFRQLLRVSGVGARMALAILSGLSVEELGDAVASQQAARLVKVPGIGKKTAERLLLELKGKIAPGQLELIGHITNATHDDIAQALLALGYTEKDAAAALQVLPADVGVTDGIKLALKKLSGSK